MKNYQKKNNMKWNWQKIRNDKNVPAFEKVVMLYEKRDDKHYCTVGYLKSIDKNGLHWQINPTNDIFAGFGFIKNDITPTHWCEIQIPEDE